MKISFGDLPQDGQELLTKHLRVDFSACDFKAPRWFSAWARNDAGHVTGIFAIEFPFWFEGRVTIMVLDPRCMSRRVLRAIFTAAFTNARRLTAEVEPDNRRALRQVQRMGFQVEGVRRCGLEGVRDTIAFGMLKHECRYLPGYVSPSSATLDIRDRVFVDTIVSRDLSSVSRIDTDHPDLFSGQSGLGVGFADVPAFGQIGYAGPPADMVAVDAVPHPAGMRSIHSPRGHSVRGYADDAMDFSAGTAVPHLRVAPVVDGKRPEQALVSGIGDSVSKKTFRGHSSSLAKV